MVTGESTSASTITPNRPDTLQRWRDRLLRVLVRIAVVFFGLHYLLYFVELWEAQKFVSLGIRTLLLIALLVLVLIPQHKYRLQLYTLLSIGLGLAIISTFEYGLVGIGRLHLLFTVILASLLLEPRRAVPFTVFAVTLVAGILVGMAIGIVPVAPDLGIRVVSTDALLVNTVALITYVVLIGNAIGWLINRLSRSLHETATALAERDRLNSQLELLVEARTEEVRRSQALLQTLIDNSPVAVYVKSIDGHYLLTNAFTQQALNLSQEELEGKRDLDLFGERALPWRTQEQEAIARGRPIEREVEHMQDGTLHTYYVTKFPIYDATGTMMAVGGIAYDMTPRKLAEGRLAYQLRVQLAIARSARQLLRANVEDMQHQALLMRVFEEFRQATDLYHIGLYILQPINGVPAYRALFESPDPMQINDGTPLAEVNPVFLARLLRGEPVGGPAEKIFIPGSPKHAFWHRRKIAGIAATLITVKERPWGFVGFGFAGPYRPLEPEELALLSAMAEMVGAFLSRREANHMLRQRLDDLAALHQIAQSLMSWTDLPMALQTVGRALLPLFEANRIAIWLCEEQTDNLVALAVIGHTDALSSGQVVPMDTLPPAQMVLASLNGTVTTEPACALLLGPDDGTAPSAGTYLVQPLIARKRGFGLFVIHVPPERTPFGTNERELAQIIAGMLSSAIENARLYQDTMVRTAQEERRRLARELHDSITQSLYSMTLLARAWTMTVHEATSEDLTNWFHQIEEISLQSLKEMRLLIYQLRSPQLDQQGLAEALRLRLEAVEERTGIKIHLDADHYQRILSSMVEPQLYAIAQEALNNALRHAGASLLSVVLCNDEAHGVLLEVSDNGRGFLTTIPSAGLGLITMRERAEAIGGELHVASAPGHGTVVRVTVPSRAFGNGAAREAKPFSERTLMMR